MNGGPERLEHVDLDSLCSERGHESVVLGLQHPEVRGRVIGPVPHAIGIDEGADFRIPTLGIDHLELAPGPPHDHPAQGAGLIGSAPGRAPRRLEVISEGRLGGLSHPLLSGLGRLAPGAHEIGSGPGSRSVASTL